MMVLLCQCVSAATTKTFWEIIWQYVSRALNMVLHFTHTSFLVFKENDLACKKKNYTHKYVYYRIIYNSKNIKITLRSNNM